MKRTFKLSAPVLEHKIGDYEIRLCPAIITTVTRRRKSPAHTPETNYTRDIFEFANRIQLSDGYKADCKRYIEAYNAMYLGKGKSLSSWPGLWMKIMWEQRKSLPELSPRLLDRQLVIAADLDFISISKAVQSGLLEPVPGSELLENLL
jgi:hypothetical protein